VNGGGYVSYLSHSWGWNGRGFYQWATCLVWRRRRAEGYETSYCASRRWKRTEGRTRRGRTKENGSLLRSTQPDPLTLKFFWQRIDTSMNLPPELFEGWCRLVRESNQRNKIPWEVIARRALKWRHVLLTGKDPLSSSFMMQGSQRCLI
jgi:hypothetical protein